MSGGAASPAMTPAESSGYNPTMAWRMVVLLALFALINFLDKIVFGLVAVPMMKELQLSPAEFGVMAGSFFWLFAVGGILGGLLADRISTRWIIAAMAASWAVLQFPIAFTSTVAVILVCRVVLGMAEGPSWPVTLHAIYKWFPNERRTLPAGLIGQTAGLGLIIAGLVIPQVTAAYGWRANFILLGFVGIAWLVLWLLLGREGPLKDTHTADANAGRTLKSAFANRTYLACIFAHFAAYWTLALTLTWVPVYLETGLGFDPITAGYMFSAFVAVNVVLGVLLPGLSQRLSASGMSSRSSRALLTAGTLAVAGAAYGALLLPALPPLVRVLLLGLGAGMAQTIYFTGPAMIGESTPASQRGTLLAFDNSIASLAGIIAPVVTGLLVQHSTGQPGAGYELGFAVAGAILLVACIVSVVFMHPRAAPGQNDLVAPAR